MADLIEDKSRFDPVYQIEKDDPVEGGPGGIANRQAQALANRTAWLREQKAEKDHNHDGVYIPQSSVEVTLANMPVYSDRIYSKIIYPLAIETATPCMAGFVVMASAGEDDGQQFIFHIGRSTRREKPYIEAQAIKKPNTSMQGGPLVDGIGVEYSVNAGEDDLVKIYLMTWRNTAAFQIRAEQLYGRSCITLTHRGKLTLDMSSLATSDQNSRTLFVEESWIALNNTLAPWSEGSSLRYCDWIIGDKPLPMLSGFGRGSTPINNGKFFYIHNL